MAGSKIHGVFYTAVEVLHQCRRQGGETTNPWTRAHTEGAASGPGAPLTAGDVVDRLAGELAYSTVVTILTRLYAKQLLTRTRRSPTSPASRPAACAPSSKRATTVPRRAGTLRRRPVHGGRRPLPCVWGARSVVSRPRPRPAPAAA
ncbi:BlaI/MecI/CopY family transcriptional regulator [Streptomyces sp. NRRL F-5126]|uniref:BlaI/MecI/CopY family transcriptional regulator n=1 Tax=Streptomyces sp. NRRL F-5126 TaxID=1463857 RepID=UPI00099C5C0B|nr:BlaI/MecI/CopY family transcriptional regulator [Streptomyces sp. NRRL F-5126]